MISIDRPIEFGNDEPWSISAWIYHDPNASWDFWIGRRGGVGWSLVLRDDGRVQIRDSDSDYYTFYTHNGSFYGSWSHHVYVCGGEDIRAYADGELRGIVTESNTEFQIDNIGNAYSSGSHTSFNGRMSDIRVYNRVLTSNEVRRVYNLRSSK